MKTALNDRRILLGVLFVVFGGFLLLRNLGLIPFFFPDYLFSWGSTFILVGLFALGNRENKTPGIILISIGVFNLLPKLFDVSSDRVWDFWPLILVAIGVSFILRRGVGHDANRYDGSQGLPVDYLDETAVLGGGKRTIFSTNFRGGRLTTAFGGLEINLLNSQLSEGPNVVDLFTVFGGSTLIVPADWNVKSEVTAIFGGFEDKRRFVANARPTEGKTLYIRGVVIFGGGELKSI